MSNGTGVLGIILLLLYVALAGTAFGLTIYGIYLGFCASIILGIIMIFAGPTGLVVGAIYVFFGQNLAQLLIQWLSN